MHQGNCTKAQIQGWVANRFYYQVSIPIKDAAIMANCTDISTRRQWIQRIIDHDGCIDDDSMGGIEAWLRLGQAVGLTREQLLSQELVLPTVRFAVDAYVSFARSASWQEAACSSLTEMFAPKIHQSRLDSWPSNYPWIESEGLQYFQMRLSQARRDVCHGLEITLDHFTTVEQQANAVNILQFKLDILWTMLDAMTMAYDYQRPPYHCIDAKVNYHRGIIR